MPTHAWWIFAATTTVSLAGGNGAFDGWPLLAQLGVTLLVLFGFCWVIVALWDDLVDVVRDMRDVWTKRRR